MRIININSKKLAVQLDSKILGELIEIENVVEKIGQFGNITKYKLANTDNKSIIYLDLAEDYRKFSGIISTDSNNIVKICIMNFISQNAEVFRLPKLSNENLNNLFINLQNDIHYAADIIALISIEDDYKKFENTDKAIKFTESNRGLAIIISGIIMKLQEEALNQKETLPNIFNFYNYLIKIGSNKLSENLIWEDIVINAVPIIYENESNYTLYQEYVDKCRYLHNLR